LREPYRRSEKQSIQTHRCIACRCFIDFQAVFAFSACPREKSVPAETNQMESPPLKSVQTSANVCLHVHFLKFPQLKPRFGLFECHAKKAVQITKKAYIPKNRTDTLDKKCIDYYNS